MKRQKKRSQRKPTKGKANIFVFVLFFTLINADSTPNSSNNTTATLLKAGEPNVQQITAKDRPHQVQTIDYKSSKASNKFEDIDLDSSRKANDTNRKIPRLQGNTTQTQAYTRLQGNTTQIQAYTKLKGNTAQTQTYTRLQGNTTQTQAYTRLKGNTTQTQAYTRLPGNTTQTQAYTRLQGNTTQTQAYTRLPGNTTQTQAYTSLPGNTTQTQAYTKLKGNTTQTQAYTRIQGNTTQTQAYTRLPGNTTQTQAYTRIQGNTTQTQTYTRIQCNTTQTQAYTRTQGNTTQTQAYTRLLGNTTQTQAYTRIQGNTTQTQTNVTKLQNFTQLERISPEQSGTVTSLSTDAIPTDDLSVTMEKSSHTTAYFPVLENIILFLMAKDGVYKMYTEKPDHPVQLFPVSDGVQIINLDFDPITTRIIFTEYRWSPTVSYGIKQAFLNGTGKQTIGISTSRIYGFSVDYLERKLFLTERNIRNFDLETREEGSTIWINSVPIDISLDLFHRKLYWISWDTSKSIINRLNYDGSDMEYLLELPWHLHTFKVDYPSSTIYFHDKSNGTISRMKTDGSNRTIIVKNVKRVDEFSILGEDMVWVKDHIIMMANKNSGAKLQKIFENSNKRVQIKGLSSIILRRTTYEEPENVTCPEVSKCWSINQEWRCLSKDMICNQIKDCFGNIDEFYCCHDNRSKCSLIDVSIMCKPCKNKLVYNSLTSDFVKWSSFPLSDIFVEDTFFSLCCSLEGTYSDILKRTFDINYMQKYHILRQLTGPSVFDTIGSTINLTLSGYVPSIMEGAFVRFQKLERLVLHNTSLKHIGSSITDKHQNESFQNNVKKSSSVHKNAFQGQDRLQQLIICRNSHLSTIDTRCFSDLKTLRVLEISDNAILSTIKGTFNKLTNLRLLTISSNPELSVLGRYVFSNLTSINKIVLSGRSLKHLTLSGNIPSLMKENFSAANVNKLVLLHTNINHVTDNFFGGFENLFDLTIVENSLLSRINKNALTGLNFLSSLVISKNLLLTTFENGVFERLKSLKTLTISHQKALPSFVNSYVLDGMNSLETLNIVDNAGSYFVQKAFQNVPSVRLLNISGNDLETLEGDIFGKLTHLELVDLRRNNLRLTNEIFEKNKKLTQIYSDSYAFCCIKPYTVQDKDCHAPKDQVSSCSDLIEDRVLRTCLWEIGIMASLGNAAVLLYRFTKGRKRLKQTFSIFVINLGFSDAIMGVFMLIIGFHDSLYDGKYVWNEYNWKRSLVCKVAGVLAFISSESSVMFIGLITIDRFLAMKYPIEGKRFKKRHVFILSAAVWAISFLLAILPAYLYSDFYSYSGTCIALPLTAELKPGWQFSVVIFFGLNFVMFVLIAVGQVFILREIRQSSKRAGCRHSSKDREVAMWLFMVALTDALCWFPVGIMVMMAVAGFEIPRGMYAWIIVFILPINSAINPFLYTFAPLCRNKRRALKALKTQMSTTSTT